MGIFCKKKKNDGRGGRSQNEIVPAAIEHGSARVIYFQNKSNQNQGETFN
jgi:hypothetical protein